MTEKEGNRLAAVEVKIDSLGEKIEALEKSLVERINATEKATAITIAGQDRAIGVAMTASEKAIVKAEAANNLRFCDIDKRIDDYVKSTNENIRTLTEGQTLNAGAKTGIKDFRDVITWVLVIVGFIVTYFVLRGV